MLRRADPKLWLALTCTLCASATVAAQSAGAPAPAKPTPPPASGATATPSPASGAATTPPAAAPATSAPSIPSIPSTPPAALAGTPTAAGTTAEPTPAAKEAARVAYTRGQAAFAEGRYDAARIAFEEAFTAVPNPIVLLSVSESRAKLGQIREAIAALQRYIELRPDAPDRAQIDDKIKTLANTPALVSITSVPTGAELSIDGSATTKKAPTQLEVPPGQHTLKYSLPGYKSSSELLVVEAGARYELEIVLQQAAPEAPPPAPVAAAPPLPAAAADTGPSPAVLWMTAGLGAAGIITGSVLGFLALDAQSDFESNPTEGKADHGERLALFADVGFGVGIMALATTAVLLFTSDEPAAAAPRDTDDTGDAEAGSASRAKPRASLELIPSVSPNAASATARVRF